MNRGMNYNVKPTFKAIRYFEKMTNVSFMELEERPDLILAYLYCCLLAHPENNFKMTFDEAVISFFPDNAQELVEQFSKEMMIINQFSMFGEDANTQDDNSIGDNEKSSPKEKETVFFSSVIPILVKDCGLDINFVLNEMDYTDTELFIKSNIEHKREEMESKRFWTYLTILPHVDAKKLKEPKSLIEFPWEKENRKKEAEEKMKSDKQKLIEVGILKEDNLTEEQTT